MGFSSNATSSTEEKLSISRMSCLSWIELLSIREGILLFSVKDLVPAMLPKARAGSLLINLFENPSKPGQMISAASSGAAAGALMGGVGAEGPAASAMATIFYLANMEPTGILIRLSQTIKVISKMLYVNVQYLPVLRRFLESADIAAGTLKEPSFKIVSVKSNRFRGKLFSYRLLVSAEKKFLPKIIIYFISWILRVALSMLTLRRIKFGKPVMLVLYLAPKLHLIIFNAFFVEFIFYMPRTLLHSSSQQAQSITLFALLMVYVDIVTIVHSVFDEGAWREIFIKRASAQIEFEGLKLAQRMPKTNPENNNKDFKRDLRSLFFPKQRIAVR